MADRAPLAGWRRQSDALSTIEYGDELWASVYRSPVAGAFIWYASVDPKIRRGEINNVVAAKLAAEDAARALVADMAAALGGRVVWGVPCPGCGTTEPDIVVNGETQCGRCGMIGSPVESEEDHG